MRREESEKREGKQMEVEVGCSVQSVSVVEAGRYGYSLQGGAGANGVASTDVQNKWDSCSQQAEESLTEQV